MTKQWLIVRPRKLPISFHLERRVPVIFLILTLITLLAMVFSVGYGEYPISPVDVVKTLLGLPTTNSDYAFIINTLRLPRTIVAFLIGVGLAIAGTITQSITRNPLAAPGIIGVNAGATLAA
ncbi:MAG: iron chelate uptake ABC transporter family permease subunit, partial [Cyanobacteria bacterium P01_C01_bin.72]